MNAGNETPALIPQVYIDPLQQCRPDFTLFIPKREGKFDWYVIEIDSPTYHINKQEEKKRDEFIKQQGYDVIHVLTTVKMIDKVRKIYSELILDNISYIEQLLS